PGLLEQRQVDHRRGVAHGAGVAVPVPRAADVAAALDDVQVLHASLAQPRADAQAGEPATDDGDVDVVAHRVPLVRGGVWIVEQVGVTTGGLEVLVVAVGPDPLVALDPVTLPQDVVIGGGHGRTVPAPGRGWSLGVGWSGVGPAL